MKNFIFAGLAFGITACTASAPTQDFTSENGISIRYSAYDSVPTLTAEAREMAIQHCAQFGKFANYRGGNAANMLTAEEIHQFSCDDVKTDDSAVIAGQSQRPSSVIIF